MGSAPWAVLLSGLLGGFLGVIGSVIVSRTQSRRARQEEWFRRVQWAEQLTTTDDDRRRQAGYRVLAQLSSSAMATDDDRALLLELVHEASVDLLTSVYEQNVDVTEFVRDTEHEDATEEGQ